MTLPLVLRRKFHIIPVLVFQEPVPRGNGLELLPLEFHVNVILEHALLEHVTPTASRNLAFVEIIAEQHAVTFPAPVFTSENMGRQLRRYRLVEIEKVEPCAAYVQTVCPGSKIFLDSVLSLFVVRLAVNGENVNVKAEFESLESVLLAERVGIMDFGKTMIESFIVIDSMIEASVSGVRLFSEGRDEPGEVRSRHHYVNVIVPRNETFVPDGAEKRPVGDGVSQSVPVAEVGDNS